MKSLKDYILCEQQKEIANKLFEAKYSNFTNAELDAFKDELEYLKTNHEFLNKIIDGRTVFSNDPWYKTHVVPKYDNIEYLPNSGDFLVKSNNKVGIISKDKQTKVNII